MEKIPPAQWATSYAPIRKWGLSTSNSSESINSWIKDARDKLHTTLRATHVTKCMVRQCKRREMYESLKLKLQVQRNTSKVGIKTNKVLFDTHEAGKKLHVLPGSDKYFIVDKNWEVNLSLDETFCSCRQCVDSSLRTHGSSYPPTT